MISIRTNGRSKPRSRRGGKSSRGNGESGKIRYAVVGLGYIAQVAVLPAFKHAARNSTLAALVSGDPTKLKTIGKKYKVDALYSYDQYDELLQSGEIDAVFIALPNNMHAEYTIRAAEAGVHVLCEKPMAVTEDECRHMIAACERNHVRLMIAYRLHFEEANLKAAEIAQSGKLGELRIFNSVFSMNVKPPNIRLEREMGGGTLYDIGIYCINAARYIFRAEPTEVMAFSVSKDEERFSEVDEMTGAVMRFPDNCIATFTSCFGGSDVGNYRVVGTKGDLCVEPAFEFAEPLKHYMTIDGKTREKTFPKRDQFAPELLYFSNCALIGDDPEPSGKEGLIDVRIIEALYRSAQLGRPAELQLAPRGQRPTLRQEIRKRPVKEPDLVHAASPSKK